MEEVVESRSTDLSYTRKEKESLRRVGIIYGEVGTTQFTFSVTGNVEQGDYVQVLHEKFGWVLGHVDEIKRKTNLSVEKAREIVFGKDMDVKEVLSATVVVIGYRDSKGLLQYPRIPFRVGTMVYLAQDSFIKKVIGIKEIKNTGAYIGRLYRYRSIPIYLDINAMVQKHVSILAKTGAGKSYLTGVLLEEFLKHRVTAVVIDPHGEYSSLRFPAKKSRMHDEFKVKPKGHASKIKIFSPDVELNEAKPLRFTLASMTPRELLNLMNLDARQYLIPLRKTMDLLKMSRKYFTIRDIIRLLESEENNNAGPLIAQLEYLDEMRVFDKKGTRIDEIVEEGKISIINLRGVPPDIQELVVQRLSMALFELRKRGKIPPLMLVIEEAHNYAPQQGISSATKILRTIASEGRKFGLGLCIISQRPAKVDKNILSQCNTQIILKVTNPNDLKAIGNSVEGLTKGSLEEIQRLPVGVALVTGGNISMPLFVEIRPRETKHGGESVKVV
ncbi:MAG: ATP-binding protein [Thermoplasmata archaeon]|nr:ATP-binding protein [Thermoplasmata archaeon]